MSRHKPRAGATCKTCGERPGFCKCKRKAHCAAPAGSADLAQKLAAYELTDDELMVVEALGWRAQQAKCKEVVDAVATVICALQGNWGKTRQQIDAENPPNNDYQTGKR